jgi:hypothetical protein
MKNVSPWKRFLRQQQSVRLQQIESRTLVTNQAIVEAIVQQSPQAVLSSSPLIRATVPFSQGAMPSLLSTLPTVRFPESCGLRP